VSRRERLDTYRDRDGAVHWVLIRRTSDGDWEVVDAGGDVARVVDVLDGCEDGRAQAEAVARDYVTAGRFASWAGRLTSEDVSQKGGADGHRDRRPRSPHASGAALPHPAR
jgi:hypothetical protein